MDSGLAAALEQEEKGHSVDLIPQVSVNTRSRCVLSPITPLYYQRNEGYIYSSSVRISLGAFLPYVMDVFGINTRIQV